MNKKMKLLFSLFATLNMSLYVTSCLANESEVNKKENFEAIKVEKETVDKIVVRVNGVNILKSNLEKPQIITGGQFLSLKDSITEELLFQKAVERKMLPTIAEVNKQIAGLKIRNGLTAMSDDEFEAELEKEGLKMSDYKRQMSRYIAVERLKGAEFNERIVVTSQEVDDFYAKNPSYTEEKYCIHICELTDDDVDEDGNLISQNNLVWDDLGWIAKKDLNKSLAFVSGLKKGEVSKPSKISDSYQVVKMIDRTEKNLRTLDERYTEIEYALQDQKKSAFEKEFETELKKDASIVYLT